MGRMVMAAIAGAIIAWVILAVVLHAMIAAGGYTTEALVEPRHWVFWSVGGGGLIVGLALAWLGGRITLPVWVRPVALGTLAGVASVVVPIECHANLGGGFKGYSSYMGAGLRYGVPTGALIGAVLGLVLWRKRLTKQLPDSKL